MTQKFAVVAIVLAAIVPLIGQEGTGKPSMVPIEIDAVFVDRQGKAVHDINRDEIEVWVAGYRVPLEKFMAVTPEDRARSRRSMVLVLDDITLDPALAPRVRDAGKQMVSRLREDDEMAIIALSGDTVKSTNDTATLMRTLDRYNPRATGFMRPDTLGEQVLQTVATVSRQLAESEGRKRTIVGLGSGWLFDTPLPPVMTSGRELRPEWIEAMRAMAAANATLYVIDAGGLGRQRLISGDAGFARESGGLAFLQTNDVRGAADQIMSEASTYYILTINDPPRFRTAPLREVEVRVKRPGVSARARRALAGTPSDPARARQ